MISIGSLYSEKEYYRLLQSVKALGFSPEGQRFIDLFKALQKRIDYKLRSANKEHFQGLQGAAQVLEDVMLCIDNVDTEFEKMHAALKLKEKRQ